MIGNLNIAKVWRASLALGVLCFSGVFGASASAADSANSTTEIQELKHQNELLQKQLESQQKLIESLSKRVGGLEESKSNANAMGSQAESKEDLNAGGKASGNILGAESSDLGLRLGKLSITGEGGVAMFLSEPKGQNNKATFRVDEARLFLDAPVWEDVYAYSELDIASRESTSLGLTAGELYLEFEDVSKLWGEEKMLNLRLGRTYIPFGEEYLNRFAVNNPLISHSVSDLWGTDDGVELYGTVGPVKYVVAVQNGGVATSQALQSDKTVSGKLSYDPTPWLHLSVSGMRTGNLSVNNGMSAIWFGNGFFRSLGSAKTTHFHDNLVEGDIALNLPGLKLRTFGGYVAYGDNDPTANNHRDIYYYSVEGEHDWTSHLYSAARWSQMFARNGFPVVENGSFGQYQFHDLTTDYWRLSLAMGYRFCRSLVVKGEYTFNHGDTTTGAARTSENMFSLEAAYSF